MQSMKQCGSTIRRETDDWAVWATAVETAAVPIVREIEEVTWHLRRMDVSRGPFHRPLKFGDPEQIALVNLMQGELAFCDRCLTTAGECEDDEINRSLQLSAVGTQCKCHGLFVPGAALEPYWRAQLTRR